MNSPETFDFLCHFDYWYDDFLQGEYDCTDLKKKVLLSSLNRLRFFDVLLYTFSDSTREPQIDYLHGFIYFFCQNWFDVVTSCLRKDTFKFNCPLLEVDKCPGRPDVKFITAVC